MILGRFHQGSGIGNQLHRYVATRVLAEDKGYAWGMMDKELCKADFMELDFGEECDGEGFNSFEEKKVVENGIDIRGYDPEINFVQDNTIVDGEFQDQRYFIHRLDTVREWLKVEPLDMPDNLCVINFRGGEYVGVKDLFLSRTYWQNAIAKMREINPKMEFVVHTDDVEVASQCFPGFECVHDAGVNWRAIRYARYLILSNSSFGILPALLGDAKAILAPRYWARHNVGVWALPQNYYPRFTYL